MLSVSRRSAMACLLALSAAGCTRQSEEAPQANAAAAALSPDEAPPAPAAATAGVVDRSHRGEAMPAAALATLDGKPAPLAAYRGKPLLVNLWATWCAPCIAELPSLDRLAATVPTIALNQGEDRAKVGPFLDRAALKNARVLLDPAMAVSVGMAANLPTTILYDAAGKEVWRFTGSRDWTSPESRALVGV